MTEERIEAQHHQPPMEIPRDKRGRIRWTKIQDRSERLSLIESEVRSVLNQGFPFTQTGFKAAKRSGLAAAIAKHYPGSYLALRNNLEEPNVGTRNLHPKTTNPDLPQIRRDARGLIRWRIRGNTPEEDESIGVNNIRALFLEKVPDFLSHFPLQGDGKTAADQREEAKRFILERVGSSQKFDACFGGSSTARRAVPYFHGSFTEAIRKSFVMWGLEFAVEPLSDLVMRRSNGTIIWSLPNNSPEENEQTGNQNIRGLIWEQIPESRELLSAITAGTASEEEKVRLRLLILSNCKNFRDFTKLFTDSPTKKEVTPYFLGYYVLVLRKSLAPLGIKIKYTDFPFPKGLWRELTKEQAIAMLQEMLIDEYPDFKSFLSEDGTKVTEELSQEAKKFILDRTVNQASRRLIFPPSATVKKLCPHFSGSVIEVARCLVEAWGIPFRLRDIKMNRGLWKDKNEDECIRTLQTFWVEIFPEFKQLLISEEHDQENKMDSIVRYIIQRAGTRFKFELVFGGSCLARATVPFFEGSYKLALKKTFSPWGIIIKDSDFNNSQESKNSSRKPISPEQADEMLRRLVEKTS